MWTRFWRRLRLLPVLAAGGSFAAAHSVRADEKLAVLDVGGEVYSNVVVTTVTATDIYFNHSRGFGNAKLKNLSPELQQHFHFDPVEAGAAEKEQHDANYRFRTQLAAAKPPPGSDDGPLDDAPDPVSPQIYARSFLGQRPPQIIVDEWLTPPPNVDGKFVLVNFWSASCEPCKDSITYLNELHAKFKDRVVFIGLSNDQAEDVRKAASPRLNYSVGIDTQARTQTALEVKALPHTILIDPAGIVRYEGVLAYLDEKGLKRLLAKYK
jgi:cytochrome c biogenesis protein CcmG, thiol:disulfide interchange protein DsbE